eukprot:5698850-Pyramimonas_sp.AAC.1
MSHNSPLARTQGLASFPGNGIHRTSNWGSTARGNLARSPEVAIHGRGRRARPHLRLRSQPLPEARLAAKAAANAVSWAPAASRFLRYHRHPRDPPVLRP